MQVLDATSHVLVRGCDVTTMAFDGLYHLTAMGTDAIIIEREVQSLRNIAREEKVITDSGIDPDVARAVIARIRAE